MCTTPSPPPERARCTAAVTEPLRLVSTRSSIGSDTPETPSTRPSSSSRDTTLPGVAPKMSVSTRTPSPESILSSSSRARSTRSSGSSWRQTLRVATCCCASPRIWPALESIEVPISPWVTIRMPITSRSPQLRFERVHEHARHVEPGLVLDLAKAGRAGDVDLGERLADDVEPDQEQSPRRELRSERLGDLALGVDERLDTAGLARHQSRCGEAREFGNGELLVVVADRIGRVEHLGAFAHCR